MIHQGASTNSGHYYAYCKGTNGRWYDCNDSFIGNISEQGVLNRQAYMLFYQKRAPPPPKPQPPVSAPVQEQVKQVKPLQSLRIEETKHSGSSTAAETQKSQPVISSGNSSGQKAEKPDKAPLKTFSSSSSEEEIKQREPEVKQKVSDEPSTLLKVIAKPEKQKRDSS